MTALTAIIGIAMAALGVATACCVARMAAGPTPFDRAVALNMAALDVVGLLLLESILLGTGSLMDAVLVIALLGFLGTVALTAFLEGWLGG